MSIKNLRYVALAEATTFLALLVATFFKVVQDSSGGESAVSVLGPIHGILFLAYVFITLGVRPSQEWSPRTTVLILAGSVIPFGGYYVDVWLRHNERPVPAPG